MVFETVKTKIGDIKEQIGDDGLGPDRGTMDQATARRKRARIEARKQKRREQRQQELEEAREKGRKEAELGISEDSSFLERAAASVASAADSVDLDGDGNPLEQELQDDGMGAGNDGGFFDGPLSDDDTVTGLGSGPFDGASGRGFEAGGDEGALRAEVDENSLGIAQNDDEIEMLEDELDALQSDGDDEFFGGGF